MVNVYIVLTLVAAFILTVVFAGLLGWEVSQQNKTYEEVNVTEWKHKNVVFDYADTGTQTIPLSCPVDKHMFINNANFQHYQPLSGGENNWLNKRDVYWISYGDITNYPIADGPIGGCDHQQAIAGFMNQSCLNAKGDCTVSVNKNGTVEWDSGTQSVCTTTGPSTAECFPNDCKFAVNISYVCTSEEEVQRLVAFSKANE